MKKLILAVVVALVGVWAVSGTATAQSHPPALPLARPMAAVIVDLNKPLPADINLKVGQNLVVQNGSVRVTFKETDGKGELLTPRPRNTFNHNAAYTAKRAGTGELTITYSVQAPGHKPMKPVTLKVTVTKLVPLPAVVPMGKPLPAKVTLEKGQKLYFHIKGTEEATFKFSTSSKLLKDGNAPTGNGVIKSFEATDVGTAEIEVQITTDVPGAKPRTHKISVEIKD
jgi:hypothetical protein